MLQPKPFSSLRFMFHESLTSHTEYQWWIKRLVPQKDCTDLIQINDITIKPATNTIQKIKYNKGRFYCSPIQPWH